MLLQTYYLSATCLFICINKLYCILFHFSVKTARRLLHRLRCSLVTRYYQAPQLQLSAAQVEEEVSTQTELWAKAEVRKVLRRPQGPSH